MQREDLCCALPRRLTGQESGAAVYDPPNPPAAVSHLERDSGWVTRWKQSPHHSLVEDETTVGPLVRGLNLDLLVSPPSRYSATLPPLRKGLERKGNENSIFTYITVSIRSDSKPLCSGLHRPHISTAAEKISTN